MIPNFLLIIDNSENLYETAELPFCLDFAVDNMLDCMRTIIPEPLVAFATFDLQFADFTPVSQVSAKSYALDKLDKSDKSHELGESGELGESDKSHEPNKSQKAAQNANFAELPSIINPQILDNKNVVNILLSTGNFPTLRARFEGPTYAIAIGKNALFGQLAYFAKNRERVFKPHDAHFLPLFALAKNY